MEHEVLVIDDVEEIVEILTEYIRLSEKQLNISAAKNGKEGLELLDKKKYSVIFVDYRMPILNGGEVLVQLREGSSKNKETPVIFVTANEEEAHPYIIKYANVLLITKPFQIKKLIATLNLLIKN